tara:strand:- start:109729 stop:111516 length:1788 start_codon:yes stop_codon:yes gene_type:complete
MLFKFSAKPTTLTFLIFGSLFFPNLVPAQVPKTGLKTPVVNVVSKSNAAVRFPVSPTPDPNFFQNSTVEQILGRMSIDDKVGQLLLVGFPQEKLDAKLAQHISQNRVGSFLIFKRNIVSIDQLKILNTSLVDYSMDKFRIPPLMAIDQEGGNVNRITTNPKLPFLFHFGDLTDSKFSYHYGYYTGQMLSSLGFNLNLAPVLDIADFNSNSFIALRSFGSDPGRVAQNGVAYSQGLVSQKVIPTAKHFPGLGSTTLDPHNTVVSNSASWIEMERNDFLPFKDFAKIGPNSAVMMSHMIYKGIDTSGLPASFSKYLMNDVLRKRLGFQGVIVTDDLHMKSSSSTVTPSEAALKSLKAGSDLVMLSWSFTEQSKTFARIKDAVIKKELSIEEVNDKVRRILTLKKYVYTKPAPENRTIASVTPAAPQIKVSANKTTVESAPVTQLLKSVLDAKMRSVFFRPQLEEKKQLCLVSDQKKLFDLIGKKDANVFKGYFYPKTSPAKSLAQFFKTSNCDLFIVTIENNQQAAVINQIADLNNKKLVIINHAIPTMVRNRARYFSVLDLYGISIKTDELLADKISEFTNMILRGQFHSAANNRN